MEAVLQIRIFFRLYYLSETLNHTCLVYLFVESIIVASVGDYALAQLCNAAFPDWLFKERFTALNLFDNSAVPILGSQDIT